MPSRLFQKRAPGSCFPCVPAPGFASGKVKTTGESYYSEVIEHIWDENIESLSPTFFPKYVANNPVCQTV